MLQKVLKVGTSAAVILPKKSLGELGLAIGDNVSVEVDRKRRIVRVIPAGQLAVGPSDLPLWTKELIARYRPALDALAKINP